MGERDLKFASQVKDQKQKESQRCVELEGRKHQKRQQEREKAEKYQEEQEQRRRQLQTLDEQREAMIKQRALERNKREAERIQSTGGGKTDAPNANAAVSPTSTAPPLEQAQ